MIDPPKRSQITSGPVAPEILRADVAALMDAISQEGGVAIAPLDVAYAVVAATRGGLEAIFQAKRRSWDKPSGLFGDADLSEEIHSLPSEKREMIRIAIDRIGLPFSVVAPFRRTHPFLAAAGDFVVQRSTKSGTLDMLLNAGPFHDEIARQSRERGRLVFGSSANTSLQGSKYALQDIEAPVREAAAIAFDYGRSTYANPHGRSSTIIDFTTFSVLRIGVEFERLAPAFSDLFGVTLAITDTTAGRLQGAHQ